MNWRRLFKSIGIVLLGIAILFGICWVMAKVEYGILILLGLVGIAWLVDKIYHSEMK